MGVFFETAARAISVPARLVMGSGDAPISAHTHPALTTVAVDGARIGRETARLLVERLGAGGRRPPRPRRLDVAFTIVSRGIT